MNPRSRRLIVSGVLVLLLLLAVIGAVWRAASAHAAPTTAASAPSRAFTVADPRIDKVGGMARDIDRQLFWVANGGTRGASPGVIYALGVDGRVRGTMDFAARPIDIEGIAMQGVRLLVGDIGDPEGKRDKIAVYYFDNPAPGDNRSGQFRLWEFTYPDGPHDAATLLVDKAGRIHIVTREARGGVYAAPRQPRAGTNELTRVADAPAYVTDGTALPDGRIALRTYGSVEVVDGELFSPVTRASTPYQAKGESITMSLDNQTLLLGSKGAGQPVMRMPVPTKLLEDVPAGASTPPASTVPTPQATPTPEPSADLTHDRGGTIVALVLALIASLAGAAVVWWRGARSKEDDPAAGRPAEREPDAAGMPGPEPTPVEVSTDAAGESEPLQEAAWEPARAGRSAGDGEPLGDQESAGGPAASAFDGPSLPARATGPAPSGLASPTTPVRPRRAIDAPPDHALHVAPDEGDDEDDDGEEPTRINRLV